MLFVGGLLWALLSLPARADTPTTTPTSAPVSTSAITPELQHSLAGVIDAAKDGAVGMARDAESAIKATAKVVQEQAPDVARQLVEYQLISNAVPAIAGFVIMLSFFGVMFAIRKQNWLEQDSCCPDMTRYGFVAILAFIMGSIGMAVFFCHLDTIAQCYFTPKAVLFEMVKQAIH
jgi:hypothetical protein